MFSLLGKTKHQNPAAVVPGQQGLAIAAIGQGAGQPRLETCDFVPWSGTDHARVLGDTVRKYGLNKRACTTVMELGDCTILSVDAPDVPANELRAAVRWQIKDLIDFHIDDAVIDVFDAPASGAGGRKKGIYVVVSRTSTVRDRVTQLQGAEARLATIDIPELVLRNISARLPEDQAGVAFIYLQQDRGLMIITRQQTLYMARTLDMGSDYLHQGAAAGDEQNPAFDRLVLEVQRSLDYYDRYFMQPPVAGIVLAPQEQPLPGLTDYLRQALGVPARFLDLAEVIDLGAVPLSARQQAQCLPAIGAALRQEAHRL